MRILFTLVFFTLSFHQIFAQQRTINGRLTSPEDGTPLVGVNVVVKGTSVGTTTDVDGRYSIQVPVGATLVFSFIGMETKEVVVTDNNLRPATPRAGSGSGRKKRDLRSTPVPRSLYSDSTKENGIGVAVLTDKTPSYNKRSSIDVSTIRSIRRSGNTYIIRSDSDPQRTGFGVQFTSSIGVEKVNKLPSFQNQFAQGRSNGSNLQWFGADQNEIFSWGPLVRTLEFDGSDYAFDNGGRLVPSGTGNGKSAKKYNALSFFRSGMVNANELMITLPARGNSTFIFDLENRTRSGIIPNSQYRKTNLNASLKNYKVSGHLVANTSVSFNRSAGDLLNRGANLASIIGSVYRTPVTFDNANGFSPTSARSSAEAYEFLDNTKRSHAPGMGDNPYGLINELPDNEKFDRLMSNLNLQYSNNSSPFSIVFNGNADHQRNTTNFGTPPGYSGFAEGRLTRRIDTQTFVNGILTTSWRGYVHDGELKANLSYQVEHSARELNRSDGYYFDADDAYRNFDEADSTVYLQRSLDRTSHQIILNAQYEYHNWLNARLTNRNYFSNTIRSSQYSNFFPTASISIDLAEVLRIWQISDLYLYTTLSRTLREAPLLFTGWAYGSTNLPVGRYATFYESNELFFNNNIAPETERKFETGLKFQSGRVSAQFLYFNNMTDDFIAPVFSSENFALRNVASIKNYGATFSFGYSNYSYYNAHSIHWGFDLKWSKYNSVVQDIYSSEGSIALAGFQSAQSVLAPDKPAGAIYGTTYLKNAEGKKTIGADGFPIEDESLKMIGNPIPDWNLGCSAFIQRKRLKLSLLLDVKKGGDVWNGTNAMLDYLGRSSQTGKLRNTSNYVFKGADAAGNPNITPVDFYDPALPLTDNRWVRYNWDGVGEDYIEDASWIRLSELVLSYTARLSSSPKIRDIKFSLIGRNLFLITPYSGIDPSSSLFGYGTGNGLDLFNTPSTRSYSAQITIKL